MRLCTILIVYLQIGSSIAAHLRQQHIGTVIVYDIDPIVLMRAASQDFVVCDKPQFMKQAKLIFCATGNKAFSVAELSQLGGASPTTVTLVSCTSRDDEFDLSDPFREYDCLARKFAKGCKKDNGDKPEFAVYDVSIERSVKVCMLVDGDAANFVYKAILGDYIRAVQAAMMVACLLLIQEQGELQLRWLKMTCRD